MRMRLCHFGYKYDINTTAPSGSYIQVMSNETFGCNCKPGIDQHTLDWYGKSQRQAEWRRDTLKKVCTCLCSTLVGGILDSNSSPRPTRHAVYPTEARLRQTERLKKDKEAGRCWPWGRHFGSTPRGLLPRVACAARPRAFAC